MAMDLGMGLGMIIAGLISQRYSISKAFLCCSAYCTTGLVLFRLFTLKHYLKKRLLVLVTYENLNNEIPDPR
jgi:predicted MFS family arabinose efflux permease